MSYAGFVLSFFSCKYLYAEEVLMLVAAVWDADVCKNKGVGCKTLLQTAVLINCLFLVCLYFQDLCRQYKL